MRRLLPLLGVAAMIGLAAPAYADPPATPAAVTTRASSPHCDKVGITYASPAQPSRPAGRCATCLNNGESGLELVHDVKTHNPGMDMENASNFAMIAAKFYCPQHLSKA